MRSHLPHTATLAHLKSLSNATGGLLSPYKTREIHFTELLHNTLLSHTDPAHNCLTFSDLWSACCYAPPSLHAASAITAKRHTLKYCPKPHSLPTPTAITQPLPWLLTCVVSAIYALSCCSLGTIYETQTKDAYSFTNYMTPEK